MSEYLKTTNFTAKDSLPAGDVNKKIVGAQFDTEFNNISTAIASKADLSSPALVGVPTAPTATAGNNTTQVATTAFVTTAVTNERSATATLTNKTISGGSVTGITDLAVADGGTGASTASDARSNLGLVIGTDVAPVASPDLTGTPTAPTAASGTNTTQVATTAFVTTAISDYDTALTVSTSQIEDDAVTTDKIAATGVTADTYGSFDAIPVITVNAEGQVTAATTAAFTIPDPIGVGQIWVDVTASRALSTVYTNNTGRPIQVTASVQNSATAVVGGVTIFNSYTVSCCGVPQISYFPLSFIVPDNTTYQITGANLAVWAELR